MEKLTICLSEGERTYVEEMAGWAGMELGEWVRAHILYRFPTSTLAAEE